MSDTQKMKHATGVVDEVKDRFSDLTDGLKERGQEFLNAAREKGIDMWGDVQDRGKDTWKDMKMFVRKNPGESIAIAFVAGIFVSLLMGRKSD